MTIEKILYTQEVSASKGKPAFLVFIVDQSSSMRGQIGKDSCTKAEATAKILNEILENLLYECTKDQKIIDYFYILVIAYGGDLAKEVFCGTVSELEAKAEAGSKGGDGDLAGSYIWLKPEAEGGTPMTEAFILAEKKIQEWIQKYPDSFPPVVLNITDGAPNQKESAEKAAKALLSTGTSDGNTLLFSCHISESKGEPIEYPNNSDNLPDQYAKWLYQICSPFPPVLAQRAKKFGCRIEEGGKGFVFNGDSKSLFKFFQIGTRLGDGD